MIQHCYEAIKVLGYQDIGIDIGHVDFVKGLSTDKKNALLQQDYLSFGDIPQRGDDKAISTIPYVCDVYNHLQSQQLSCDININKGLVKGIKYYSGLIFEVYQKSTRHVIASGGRYDHLLGSFGFDQPAFGFAINLTHLRDIKQ